MTILGKRESYNQREAHAKTHLMKIRDKAAPRSRPFPKTVRADRRESTILQS